ncbi:cytochrome d ubiquinol oxidase subunit II [Niallia sp. 01092]|uniref:cytochrome d ubiquinol oxidase subunit II n=1 Tax=unclassified Niallia TaxID=2837522 RepID=UPI003FCFFC7C
MLELNVLWFILVAVLFIGFFFLEGFDFGVGMSTQIIAKNDMERRILINSIGPFWDANEVWLITAGGALFAAFPHWYATLFSGFYTPLVVVLLALIIRATGFEFRAKGDSPLWKKSWDVCIFLGSLLPPLLFGVVFACFMQGLPIDKNMELKAGFFDIVNYYTLVGGLTVLILCLVHGLMFTTLRTVGDLQNRARKTAQKLLPLLGILLAAFSILTYIKSDIFDARGEILTAIFGLGVIVFVLAGFFISRKRDGWAFGMTGGVIILSFAAVFIGLFPRVMISSISETFSLTISNAASGNYSLKVMTIVALTLLPFVLGYQIWSYIVFRKRVTEKSHLEY